MLVRGEVTTPVEPPILGASELVVDFASRRSVLDWRAPHRLVALAGVSLKLGPRETLAVVGESGCGKSTLLKALLGLQQPTAGTVTFDGQDLRGFARRQWRRFRRDVQPVFQDPWSSLNPRHRVTEIVSEPLLLSDPISRADRDARVRDVLSAVGIDLSRRGDFPHQFSGGQRQRIAIARALVSSPRAILLDEPLSALDVSIRAQIRNLLRTLQETHSLSYVFVSHDLADVLSLSSRVAVMYAGRIVESGSTGDVLTSPLHPYTKALVGLARHEDFPGREQVLQGEAPPAAEIAGGCPFAGRCAYAVDLCRELPPELTGNGNSGQAVACHAYGDSASQFALAGAGAPARRRGERAPVPATRARERGV